MTGQKTLVEVVGEFLSRRCGYVELKTAHSAAVRGEILLEGASAVDLIVGLLNALLRFLGEASAAVEHSDADARRNAVKRALGIVTHLQMRLRMEDGRTARVLSEFYAAIFAQILQTSQSASQKEFRHVIKCVERVRDAWREVGRNPNANLSALPIETLR